jgi:hypothetical protein
VHYRRHSRYVELIGARLSCGTMVAMDKNAEHWRCTVRWNPGHWPYVTRCVLDAPHSDAPHEDINGYTIPNVPGQIEHETTD